MQRFRLKQVLTSGSLELQSTETVIFPLKTGFRYSKVPHKTGPKSDNGTVFQRLKKDCSTEECRGRLGGEQLIFNFGTRWGQLKAVVTLTAQK